jgi:hypothetical protein
MRRRSNIWFIIAAAWLVIFLLNVTRQHGSNAAALGAGVLLFAGVGLAYRRSESKAAGGQAPGSRKSK